MSDSTDRNIVDALRSVDAALSHLQPTVDDRLEAAGPRASLRRRPLTGGVPWQRLAWAGVIAWATVTAVAAPWIWQASRDDASVAPAAPPPAPASPASSASPDAALPPAIAPGSADAPSAAMDAPPAAATTDRVRRQRTSAPQGIGAALDAHEAPRSGPAVPSAVGAGGPGLGALDAALERDLERLRVLEARGAYAEGARLVSEMLGRPLERRAREVLSNERARLWMKAGDRDAACEALSAHAASFPDSPLAGEIEAARVRLSCRPR
jgi:hypothetical protein